MIQMRCRILWGLMVAGTVVLLPGCGPSSQEKTPQSVNQKQTVLEKQIDSLVQDFEREMDASVRQFEKEMDKAVEEASSEMDRVLNNAVDELEM